MAEVWHQPGLDTIDVPHGASSPLWRLEENATCGHEPEFVLVYDRQSDTVTEVAVTGPCETCWLLADDDFRRRHDY